MYRVASVQNSFPYWINVSAHRKYTKALLQTTGTDDDCSLGGAFGRQRRAFEHHFGPRGRKSSEVQVPGVCSEGCVQVSIWSPRNRGRAFDSHLESWNSEIFWIAPSHVVKHHSSTGAFALFHPSLNLVRFGASETKGGLFQTQFSCNRIVIKISFEFRFHRQSEDLFIKRQPKLWCVYHEMLIPYWHVFNSSKGKLMAKS